MVDITSIFLQEVVIGNWKIFLYSIIVAILIIGLGIFLGKLFDFIIRKLVDRANLQRLIKPSFIGLFIAVARWSIYLIFLNIGLEQLNIPDLTNWLVSILVVIPALVGSLLLLAVGFGLAIFLKDVIEESEILNWKILGNVIFYFVLYIFLIFALRTALSSFDKLIVNIILIVLTGAVAISAGLWLALGRNPPNIKIRKNS